MLKTWALPHATRCSSPECCSRGFCVWSSLPPPPPSGSRSRLPSPLAGAPGSTDTLKRRRIDVGARQLSPLGWTRPSSFRYVERASPNRAAVHDDVNRMASGPRNAGRVYGEGERRLQLDALARPESDPPQFEDLGRTHSAGLDEVHADIDQQLLLPCGSACQRERHGYSSADAHSPRSEGHGVDGYTWHLPVAEQLERSRLTAFHRAAKRVLEEDPPLGRC